MSEQTTYKEPTYGNWRKPRTAGIGKLGALETMAMIAALLVLLFIFRLAGPIPGFIAFIVLAVALVVFTIRDQHGQSRITRMLAKRAHRKAVNRRTNLYRSGPTGLVPGGTAQLPGLLAKSQLHQFVDSFDRPFALVFMPDTNHATVVIECEPTGLALEDPQTIDTYVANWGGWLADLGKQSDVVAASVTVETAPDFGVRLRQWVDSNRHPDAPPATVQMMEQIKETFPQSAPVTRAFLAVTVTAWRQGAPRPRKVEDLGIDLAARLGKLTEHLEQCGAGDAHPVTAQTLCEVVRSAYDPAVAQHIAAAHAESVTPALSWNDVGPIAHNSGWEWYRHDSGFSKSWVMSVAPRGEVFSNVLEAVLSPTGEVDRKRVTFLFRPVSAARAMDVAEKDVNAASSRANSTNTPNFRAIDDYAKTVQTAKEIAKDAGMLNFGVVITATTRYAEDALAVSYTMEDLAAESQLTVRPAYGAQDTAFAASLPLGLVLPDYVMVPSKIREAV
ncbi:SCO6880 family protein [Arthrobacter sp. RCC_34]|uniref:SCO6880 family protein n=1 Tax=Arthrobacter sp. RCC_34 TaxID=3239230 RepID=UPI003525569C